MFSSSLSALPKLGLLRPVFSEAQAPLGEAQILESGLVLADDAQACGLVAAWSARFRVGLGTGCRLDAKHNLWCVPCRRHHELFAIYLWCVVPSRLSRPRCPRSEPVCFNVVNDGSQTGNELAFQGYCLHPRRG